jgi:hypothetical protein
MSHWQFTGASASAAAFGSASGSSASVSPADAIAMLRALPAHNQQERPALFARCLSAGAQAGGQLAADISAEQTAQLLEIGN